MAPTLGAVTALHLLDVARGWKHIMSNTLLAAIIAGTHHDTELGQDLLRRLGWRTLACAMARTPTEQDMLQRRHPHMLQALCAHAIDEMDEQGAERVIIYCSSLSSVLDLPTLRCTSGIPVHTPLDSYAEVARNHARIAVLAANDIGLAGAIRVLRAERADAEIHGMHDLPLVCALERGEAPDQVIDASLLSFMEHAKRRCDALLLACTHFPVIADYLADLTRLPIYHYNHWLERQFGRVRSTHRAQG